MSEREETSVGQLDRTFSMEIVRATERAAIAASKWCGRGDERAADQAAVTAMRHELNRLDIRGTVVIGEGERDQAPMLFIGEELGTGSGPEVDIAVDPLEGTTICAKNGRDSMAVIAVAEVGHMLRAPDVYMEKIAIGPGFPRDLISLDASVTENVEALAKAKGVRPDQVRTCVLDRPRHQHIIEALRTIGASIKLVSDGDVAAVINTVEPDRTDIDMYIGTGGAPEGVLAAAALRCIGGQIQGRLVLDRSELRDRAQRMGVTDPQRIYHTEDMASGDVFFAATGVTEGKFLDGIRRMGDIITSSSVVMRSSTRTARWINARHQKARIDQLG